jgi:GT2 family glycosyltransferase
LKPKVHIVLLNWNSWSDISNCLSSLQSLQYENRKVIVVDNGSADDSVFRIRSSFPWAEVVLTGKNFGFSGGCNAGIRRALAEGTDYVWLLNPDTVVDPAALDRLVDKAESDTQIGAVGSAIYCMEQPAQLQAWGGGYVNFWTGRAGLYLRPVPDEKIQYITGASLLIAQRVLQTAGLLDEGIFLYWEDTEYCWRLRAAGWKLAVAGDSKIWHKGMSTHGRKSRLIDSYYSASAARFFMRHSPQPMFSLWVGVSLRMAKRLILGDWARAYAVWAGAKEGSFRNGHGQTVTSPEGECALLNQHGLPTFRQDESSLR